MARAKAAAEQPTTPDVEIPPMDIPPANEPARPSEPEAEPAAMTADQAKTFIFVLGQLEAWIASTKWFKVPPDIARQVFTFSPEDCEMLAEPAAAVLNKYVPTWIRSNSVELTLLVALLSIHQQKFMMLMMLMQQRAEARQAAPSGGDSYKTPMTSVEAEG